MLQVLPPPLGFLIRLDTIRGISYTVSFWLLRLLMNTENVIIRIFFARRAKKSRPKAEALRRS